MSLKAFENQQYLNIETIRKNGHRVQTPVWFVQDGEVLYVRTIKDSGKVKRILRNKDVRVMPCGRAGEPLGEWHPAFAHEVPDPAVFARLRELLLAKYGPMVATFEAQAAERGQVYTIIKIEF